MFNGILPIGSVVLLKNSTKKVMIVGIGQLQQLENGDNKLWDYSACLYPEGYLGPDKTYMFNEEQIDKIFALGYQDEDQFAFANKAREALTELRNKQVK